MTTDKATTRHNVFVTAYNENRHENFHPLKEAFLQEFGSVRFGVI